MINFGCRWSDQNSKQPEFFIKHNICVFWNTAWCCIVISTMSWMTRISCSSAAASTCQWAVVEAGPNSLPVTQAQVVVVHTQGNVLLKTNFVWNVSLQEKGYLSENVTNYQQNFKSNLWRVKFASNLLSGKTNGEIKFHIVHWGPGSFQDPPRWSAWSWGATLAGRSAPRVWGGRALWRDTGPAKRIEFNIFWGGQRTCSTLFKFHHLLFIMLMSSLRHRVSAIPARRGSPFWGRRGPSRSWQLCCTRLGTAARSPGGQPW